MSQVSVCIGLGAAFMVLPILAVGARIWAISIRETRTLGAKLHLDDYLIFIALLFSEATGATMLYAVAHGNLGQHLTYAVDSEVPDQADALVIFSQAEYALEIFVQMSILASKVSLLALYRRIFDTPAFRRAVHIVGAIVIVWHTSFLLLFIMQCLPVSAVWDTALESSARCLNKLSLWDAYAICDVLTDTIVLSLPVPAIMSLQMSTQKKISVSMMFMLGSIVIASGIARTIFFFIISQESFAQITYNSTPCIYWSFIETSTAVVGACLPTLRPLFRKAERANSAFEKWRHIIHAGFSKDGTAQSFSTGGSSAKELKP